ncbi:MAG: DUF177 domain-containing protein [Myxococcota bacterium]|jgi:uncharacterized protein|nr:DUF177 domain-containing protein [Myxococcota bacterium]
MKIIFDRLTRTPVEEVFEAPESWWRERAALAKEFDYDFRAPLTFTLRSYKTAADVILEGSFASEIEVECGRCLTRYCHSLHDQFRLVAEEARGRVPADPEGVESLAREGLCLAEEIESAWYQGSVIKLDGVFGEVVAGAIPAHPLCNEDCKGLCPQCGVSKNESRCGCVPEVIEIEKKKSPFAVLAKLRDESAKGN